MRGHADPDTLAMFREGLLPRRRAARVAAHLAHCPQCAGVDAQLADLPALLADAPAPPMPDALAARIAAALAAEAAAGSTGVPAGAAAAQAAADEDRATARPGDAAGAGDGSGSTAPRAQPHPTAPAPGARGRRAKRAARAPAPGRSRLALRIGTAAAVVVVIAGGGYGVSRLFSSGGAALSTGAPAAAPVGKHPAAPGAQPGPTAARPGTKEHAASSAAAGYPIVSSRTNYRSGRLEAQARAVLSRFSGGAAPHSKAAVPPPARTAELSSCLAHFAGGQRPRLVDLARYNGEPATVIMLPAGTNTLRVLVVGPDCSAPAKDLLASATLHGPG